jgi:phosphatidylethanolamine-binding protein (PEBP) family uncharacterized protein
MAKRTLQKKRKMKRRATRRRKVKQRGGADLLNNTGAPPATGSNDFNVKFQPNNALSASPNGNSMGVMESTPQPYTTWSPPQSGSFNTVICWDPDATKSPGPNQGFAHWIVTNCSGKDTDSGNEILDWTPPNPPKESGEHRYIFGLFSQAEKLETAAPDRNDFKIESFVKANNLTALAYKGIRVKS